LSRVVVLGAQAESLVNFRGDLIRSLAAAGHEVFVMEAMTDDATRASIEALGASFRPYPVQRSGMDPRHDLTTLLSLRTALAETKPDLVLAHTIKPVIWGGLALRSLDTAARFYGLITGLGLAFQAGGVRQKVLTGLVTSLYRQALVRAEKVIFQNRDDRQVFVDRQIVPPRRCVVVDGSGVNISHFEYTPLPTCGTTFLAISRLLYAKGLREYVQAAKIVKERYSDAIFNLIGPEDPSPNGIPLAEVREWHASGAVNYLGAVNDVRPYIGQSHVFVLPSYYPEGMPRSILEAMSMGRPILTTDVPGCRETVVPGENGHLVPKENAKELAERMIWFIDNRDSWQCMGEASRRMAEDRFDVRKINEEMLRIMGLSVAKGGPSNPAMTKS
jgi:glycosyltransferase involved in cell wall biosynthesis